LAVGPVFNAIHQAKRKKEKKKKRIFVLNIRDFAARQRECDPINLIMFKDFLGT